MPQPCAKRSHRQGPLLALLACACLLLTACGVVGPASPANTIPPPTISSTPNTAASEGTSYTYQIATSPAVGVTLALVDAPAGASVQASTLTWTPAAAQSRVPNQFSITATDSAGSVTQKWSVTPTGTLNGTLVNTSWGPSGPVQFPVDWTKIAPAPQAIVPQADGSFQILPGSGSADGTFHIANIPGGYYWLQIFGNVYWTSSSTFDAGMNLNVPVIGSGSTPGPQSNIVFNLSGLDPLQTSDQIAFFWNTSPPFSLILAAASPVGATSLTTGILLSTTLDLSQSAPAYLLQYEPESVGALNAERLGAAETLPNVSMNNGGTSTINGTLAPSPEKSFDVSIKGSAWASLFTNAGPSSAAIQRTGLDVRAQPYMQSPNVLSTLGLSIALLASSQGPAQAQTGFFSGQPTNYLTDSTSAQCAPSFSTTGGSTVPNPAELPITTDQDFGPATFGDPFPSAWPRIFSFCETATVPIAIPGSSTPVFFGLLDLQSSALPTSPVAPLIGQVQNPTLNGSTIFTANTVSSTGIKLSWTAPAGATPTGYEVIVLVPNTTFAIPTYGTLLKFYTTKTSVELPPLPAGQTYAFLIKTLLDGAANFETSPNRSALPTASVSVVSAPFTTTSAP